MYKNICIFSIVYASVVDGEEVKILVGPIYYVGLSFLPLLLQFSGPLTLSLYHFFYLSRNSKVAVK
jgi:hypothetical protein